VQGSEDSFFVDERGAVVRAIYRFRIRALIDDVDSVRDTLYDGAASIGLGAVDNCEIIRTEKIDPPGTLRLEFRIPLLNQGDECGYSYEVFFQYTRPIEPERHIRREPTRPQRSWQVTVNFHPRKRPYTVWFFQRQPRLWTPGTPTAETTLTPRQATLYYKEFRNLEVNWCYGIAWSWLPTKRPDT
jgi:hypothetical protein